MALAYRVRTVITGLDGGPYLSTHIFSASLVSDPVNAGSAVDAFWTAIRTRIYSTAAMNVENEIETFDVESGAILGTGLYTGATTTGANTNPASWTAKQGVLKLRTNIYRNGRRIQGRLFIPGVTRDAGDQHPISGYKNDITAAAINLRDDSTGDGVPWSVWSRPSSPDASDGRLAPVYIPSVNDEWGVLRSRRT